MRHMRETISRYWESTYPYVIGLGASVTARFIPSDLPVLLTKNGFSLPAFYSAVFNIDIFGAGVMISVFVFTQAPAAGFIAKLERLSIYSTFKRYLKEAIFFGLLSGILCMPLLSSTDKLLIHPAMGALSVFAVSTSICFFLLFYRVSRIFLFWTSR